jgi:hypothetical protein
MRRNSLIFHLVALLAIFAIPVFASPVYLVPPGLHDGDQYRLIFLTSATTSATSEDISYYDSFVNDVANGPQSLLQPLGATWQAIVSTSTVSAADHLGPFSVPVYLVDGQQVADGSQGLWSASVTTPLGEDVSIDEKGDPATSPFLAWTGTRPDGSQADPLGGAAATVGCTIVNTSQWIDYLDENTSQSLPLYGISSILTVPEPETFGMLFSGGLLLIVAKRIRTKSTCRQANR